VEQDVKRELSQAVGNYDVEAAEKWAHKAIELKMDPLDLIANSLTPAIEKVGKLFDCGDIFLPHLVMAGDAMLAAINVLKQDMSSEQLVSSSKGTIVIGTVKGDVHNIGKNIVGIMLTAGGYNVIDLGIDVEPFKFVEEAQRNNADIIAVSALMTFTAQNMKMVSEYLEMEGLRDKFKLIFGGGPLNEQWAKEMGADGYALDANRAVAVVNRLLGR
jgi:corrinoid protein of di/trimethylamine methyltransferase